ncbi:hypothetical protein BJX65DRAFT_316362 [Aspergillus insuetus]
MATKPTAQPERVERRREQNRNNQRAYRGRKLLQAQLLTDRKTEAGQNFSPSTGAGSNSKTLLLKRILVDFVQSATESYTRGEPSADHLLSLTKVNVVRAFTRNLRSLGWPRACMERSAISPFVARIPASLRPTHRQQSVLHHPWLTDRGGCDCEQLCSDIMDFWRRSEEHPFDIALLVWGEPSDKWAWVVLGCPEILESTNSWRRKRGGKLILRYL